ncbi:MAG: hypothetical protein GY851_23590, partial [bacterium]|nr:hypothetical protein [bacterium]
MEDQLEVDGNAYFDDYVTVDLGIGLGTTPNSSYGIIMNSSTAPSYGGYFVGDVRGVWGGWSGDPVNQFAYLGGEEYGVFATAGTSSSSLIKIGGEFNATTTAEAKGVLARANGYGSDVTAGVSGYAYNYSTGPVYGGYFVAGNLGTGLEYGVYGLASNYGVRGAYLSDPDDHFAYMGSLAYGVYANSGASDETSSRYGGRFYSRSQSSSYGVRTTAYGYGTSSAYGVYGSASNSTSTGPVYALYGTASAAGGGSAYGLYVSSGTKSWVNPDPDDPTKAIVYATLEGGENGTYWRGTARLTDGFAEVALPDHFRKVTSPEHPVTVTVTPVGECNGLMLVERGNERIVVKELMGGQSDVEFDFIIMGMRLGYEDFNPYIDNVDYVPFQNNHEAMDESE